MSYYHPKRVQLPCGLTLRLAGSLKRSRCLAWVQGGALRRDPHQEKVPAGAAGAFVAPDLTRPKDDFYWWKVIPCGLALDAEAREELTSQRYGSRKRALRALLRAARREV